MFVPHTLLLELLTDGGVLYFGSTLYGKKQTLLSQKNKKYIIQMNGSGPSALFLSVQLSVPLDFLSTHVLYSLSCASVRNERKRTRLFNYLQVEVNAVFTGVIALVASHKADDILLDASCGY